MLPGIVRGAAEALTDLLYPRLCPRCDIGLSRDENICSDCRSAFEFTELGNWIDRLTTSSYLDGAWSALWFDDELQRLIHQLKYEGRRENAAALVDIALSRGDAKIGEKFDRLVAVPLHRTKKRERGFNQAELIAARLSAAWQIPVANDLLKRRRLTTSQTGLDIGERIANIAGSFVAAKHPASGSILLVDDVLTTGATASACAAALKGEGCLTVAVFSIATPLLEP